MTGYEVQGKKIGISAFGAIGRGKNAFGLGMHIMAFDVFGISEDLVHDIQVADVETILGDADFISLHIPLTKETENMISARNGTDEIKCCFN